MIHAFKGVRLNALQTAVEKKYELDRGILREPGRWQPLASYRHLFMLVAGDAGMTHLHIANYLGLERSTVGHGICTARRNVKNHGWWAEQRADLVDRWDEEWEAVLERQNALIKETQLTLRLVHSA